MTRFKVCTKCKEEKNADTDYYLCAGKMRSECKACTIKKNVSYQKQINAWKTRYGHQDIRRSYMRDYYARNKEKFAVYRFEFRKRHPNYHVDYFKARQQAKSGSVL